MDCPKCGLINPATAQRCDCGYDFETRTSVKPIPSALTPLLGGAIRLPTGSELMLAGLKSRLLGQSIDGLIALALALACILIIHLMKIDEMFQWAICLTVYLGYILFCDGFKGGQSLGKIIMKTAVVNASNGSPCSYCQSFLRNIFQVFGFFDWLFVFGKKRQRLGDIAAGTIVIQKISYLKMATEEPSC
jgi:uncharacterized RDD family membrane protein YckC